MGNIVVPTGSATDIPPFNMHVLAGTTCTITEVYAYLLSGSMTLTIDQNGTPIPGLSAITITSTPTIFTPTSPISVADLDQFYIIPLTVSSAIGLTLNFFKTVKS